MARAADPALAEWWLELIELADESSLAVAEFCRLHNVSTASFYNRRRKFRDTDRDTDRDMDRDTDRERGGFVPVKVTSAEQRIDQPLLRNSVRVVWPQGVVMEIPAGDRELVLLVAGTLAGTLADTLADTLAGTLAGTEARS